MAYFLPPSDAVIFKISPSTSVLILSSETPGNSTIIWMRPSSSNTSVIGSRTSSTLGPSADGFILPKVSTIGFPPTSVLILNPYTPLAPEGRPLISPDCLISAFSPSSRIRLMNSSTPPRNPPKSLESPFLAMLMTPPTRNISCFPGWLYQPLPAHSLAPPA